jgi:Regulator of chromosome condensation (RCC1) repeat
MALPLRPAHFVQAIAFHSMLVAPSHWQPSEDILGPETDTIAGSEHRESAPDHQLPPVSLFGFGSDGSGRLGIGDESEPDGPTRVDLKIPTPGGEEAGYDDTGGEIVGVRLAHCGGYGTIAVGDDGTVFTFGAESGGQLGFDAKGEDANVPTPVPFFEGHNVRFVAAGYGCNFVCSDRGLFAFGKGGRRLGTVVDGPKDSPKRISFFDDKPPVTALWSGGEVTMFLCGGDLYQAGKSSFFEPKAGEMLTDLAREEELDVPRLVEMFAGPESNIHGCAPAYGWCALVCNGYLFVCKLDSERVVQVMLLRGELAEKVVLSDKDALVLTQSGELQTFKLNNPSAVEDCTFFHGKAIEAAYGACVHFLVKADGKWWGFGGNSSNGLGAIQGTLTGSPVPHTSPVAVDISPEATLPEMGFEVSRNMTKAARKR